MNKLVATRFNNTTWTENTQWRERNTYSGCIYNSPVYIKESIPLRTILYVIEMNNDTNKILGFGKIINKVYTDKIYKIYTDRNYNRYTYKGTSRVDIKDITQQTQIKKLEERLFKSKSHLKRHQGITQMPINVTKEYLPFIRELFNDE